MLQIEPYMLSLVAAALALGVSLYKYGGNLARIPRWTWTLVEGAVDHLRRSRYSYETDAVDLWVATDEIDAVREALAKAHFDVDWDLSVSYVIRGEREALNMRRPVYVSNSEYPYQQDHVRGAVVDGCVALNVHREPVPTEYPRVHLRSKHLESTPAVDAVAEVLIDAGFEVGLDGGAGE